MPYNTSTGLPTTGLESFTPVTTIYQANPRRVMSSGTYPSVSYIPVAYRGTPFYYGQVYSIWKFQDDAAVSGHVMIDDEPYILDPGDGDFRENDPLYTNLTAALRVQREMAQTISEFSQLYYTEGSKIGLYDFVPLIYRNINKVLNNTPGDFNIWMRNQEKVATTPVWDGQSMIDIINSLQGKFYVTCYVPTSAFDTNSFTRGRYRRYVKRLMSFYNGLGMEAVPLLYPFYGDTVSTPVSSNLLQGIIDDIEAYQPGEWGVWGDTSLVTNPQWASFVAIVTG